MEKLAKAITDLIAGEVCGKAIDAEAFRALSEEELKELYKLSKKHDLAHIVGNALIKSGVLTEGKVKAAFEKEIFTAVYRYEKLNYELGEIRRVLGEAKIPFIPLKGAVIRKYYPEPWQRTSCDIDVLVKEENLDKAISALVNALGYTAEEKKNYHDISLYSPSGMHLELHFNLKETIEKLDGVLVRAWDYAREKENCEYEFDNEFLFFHLYAHASYHFVGGGCGIRPFIDFYLLRKKLTADEEKLGGLLDEAGIKFFAEKADELANVWFGDGEKGEITEEMEEFVLSGGVYGNSENHAAVKQAKKGKFGHLWSRIWLPYESLIILYPSLKGKRILQPFYEIRRWFKLFKKSTFRRSVNELKVNAGMSDDTLSKTQKLLQDLKL